ncbi:MFS transporter, partial [candidate division KSB1 bacterium]|nr:MFS transporter [candidate division KSB1 bacterium]
MKAAFHVPIKEKIGYALGDTASNLLFQTFMLFLMYFYTDIFGLSAGVVGTMMLVTRLWDAVNDPIMGTIADRTRTKWGKFRPYLIWFAVPFGIVGVLTFLAPDFSLTGKIVYAYITYTAMTMIYTAINVPYAALMGVITPNAMERTVISSYRFVGVFTALFIVQAAFLSIVNTYFADNEALGYRTVMIGVSALSVILFFITFFTTKERVAPPKEQKTVLRRDLGELFKNKPWLFIAGATVFQLTLIAMRNAAIMYYFKYYIGQEKLALFGKEIPWSGVSAFMLFGTVLTILGAISTKWFTTILNKGRAYVLFMFLTAIFVGAVIFVKPDQIELLFLF